MHFPARRLLLGLFLAATSLPAQTQTPAADPLRFVPADCQLLLTTFGPPTLAAQLGATHLGKACGGPTFAPATALLRRKLEEFTAAQPGLGAELRAVVDLLAAHRGRFVLAGRLDTDDLVEAVHRKRRPAHALTLAIGGDGGDDAKDLAAKLDGLLRQCGLGEPKAHVVAGADLQWFELPCGQLALPVVRDGCVLLLFGTDLATQAEWFLQLPAGKTQAVDERVAKASMALQLDTGRVLGPLLQAWLSGEGELPAPLPQIVPQLGLEGLRSLQWLLQPAGDRVDQEFTVTVDRQDGIWPIFLVPAKEPPAVLRLLPATARTFGTSTFDPAAFHALYAHIWDGLGDQVPVSRADFEQRFTQKLKVRLKEDVLDALTGEMLRIDDLAVVVDQDEPELDDPGLDRLDTRFGDSCFVLGLRDGRAFAPALEKAIRATGLHAARKSEDYGAARIHRVKVLASYVVEYAVTDRCLVVGLGGREGTMRNLRAVLDADAALAAGKPPLELPTAVQECLQGLPAGWCQLGVASMSEALEGIVGNLAQVEALAGVDPDLDAMLGEWEPLAAVLKALRPALLAANADVAVTVGYVGKDKMVQRTRW